MELYQVHLETVGNEPGGTFSFNPLDIQLWTWIRPLNSWVRRTLTPCHSFKLFIPSSPSNKSTRDCPPLTRHTHTHTHTCPAARYASSLSENTRQWVQASYHGSLTIIVSSPSGNGNKCAHVLKGPLGKISGAAWGDTMAGFVTKKGFGLAGSSSPAGHRVCLQRQWGKTMCWVTEHPHWEK